MRNAKIKQRQKKKFDYEEYYKDMPASVMFVRAMALVGEPIGLEVYERALAEGGEKYFPEEFEYRRKWALVPQSVKDAYDADPNSGMFNLFVTDEDAPNVIKNWPGIVAATDEDWRVHREYYNSAVYKAKVIAKNRLKVQA